MNNEEKWRQHAYETWVGESGNSSMGTIANREGYNRFLAKQKNSGGTVGGVYKGVSSGYQGTGGSTAWFTFVDDFVDLLPTWIYWLLGLTGALLGYWYVSQSTGTFLIPSYDAFFSHYAWPMALGLVGGLLVIPLIVIAVKLVLAVVVLGIMAGVAYLGQLVYQSWPW